MFMDEYTYKISTETVFAIFATYALIIYLLRKNR